jgi:WD40 repeat protein
MPTSQADKEDLRGWEWRYLWQFCQDDPHELLLDTGGRRVTRLSVSHSGRYLAASCGDRVFVRDLIRQRAVSDFPGEHATFSPAEPILAYWSPDPADDDVGSFRLWNATARKVVDNHLLPLQRGVRGVAFSGDGNTLVVSTARWNRQAANRLFLVNIRNRQHKSFDAPQIGPGAGYPFALAGDLSVAAHGSGNARASFVRVVDLKTGNELWRSTPAPRGEWIECLSLSPDNKLLAVGHGLAQPTVEIWDVEKRAKVGHLEGHSAYVRNVVFAGDRQLISSSADQTVRVWDLTDLDRIALLRTLRGHESEVGHVAVLPDGQIISGSSLGRIVKWDLTATRNRKSPTFRFDSHGKKWRIKPDQSAMISCNHDGVVSEWTGDQYDSERELFRLGPGFHRASVSLDATKLAVGRVNGDVELWDIDRQETIQSFQAGEGPMVPDQFYAEDEIVEVMHEGWWGAKFLWDLRQNRKMYVWPHTDNLISLDGTVGLAFHDSSIEMTDFRGNPPETLPESWAKSFPFGRVAISADGRYMAAIHGDDRLALLFDLQQLQQIGAFGREFMVGPSSVYFSPDNKRVIAGGVSPCSVVIADVESRQQIMTLESVGDTRRWARFSPDGNIIVAQDEAEILYGWRAPSWEEIKATESK